MGCRCNKAKNLEKLRKKQQARVDKAARQLAKRMKAKKKIAQLGG